MATRGFAAIRGAALRTAADSPSENQNQEQIQNKDTTRFKKYGAKKVTHALNAINRLQNPRSRSLFRRQISWILDKWYPEDGGLVDDAQKKIMEKAVHDRVIIQQTAVKQLTERQGIKDVLISGSVFTVMMTLYFAVILLQRRIDDAFSLEYSIKEYVRGIKYLDETGFANSLQNVHDYDALYNWMEYGYIPALNPEQEWYNGDPFSDTETGYFLEYNRLIGGVKLIQQRVDPCACANFEDSEHEKCGYCPSDYNDFYPTIWPRYSKGTKSQASFGPEHDPEKYEFYAEENNGKGGFVCVLPPDRKRAILTLQELKRDKWLDKNTRLVSLAFNAYNGNLRMFTCFLVSFIFGQSGKLEIKLTADTFRGEYYGDDEDQIRMMLEVILAVFLVVQVSTELGTEIYYRKHGEERASFHIKSYLTDITNYIDLARIGTWATLGVLWVKVIYHEDISSLELPLPSGVIFHDMTGIVWLHWFSSRIHIVTIILCMLTMFKFMNHSPVYGIVVRTILMAAPALLQFFIMFSVCFLVFAVMGVLLFGHMLKEWRHMGTAVGTLIMMVTGEYGMAALVEVDYLMGSIFYTMYLVIVFFLLVNILLAILMDAYTCLCQMNAKVEEENKINLKVGVVQEVLMQVRYYVRWGLNKMIGRTRHRRFLTNEEMLWLLTDHPKISHQAHVLERVPTMADPNPPPDILITYEVLITAIPDSKAKMLMMAVGTELNACSDVINAYVRGQQLQNSNQDSADFSENQRPPAKQAEADAEPEMPEADSSSAETTQQPLREKGSLWERAHLQCSQQPRFLIEENGHAIEITEPEPEHLGLSDSVAGIDTSEPYTPRDSPPMYLVQEKEQSPLLPQTGSHSGERSDSQPQSHIGWMSWVPNPLSPHPIKSDGFGSIISSQDSLTPGTTPRHNSPGSSVEKKRKRDLIVGQNIANLSEMPHTAN